MNKFLKNSILPLLVFLNISSKAQVNINSQWTWINGDSTINKYGSYGTPGVASNTNKPGGRYSSASWTDASNNLWLFGGIGMSANNSAGYLNDLWKFDVSHNEWTWIKGDSTSDNYSIYGMQGVSATANHPGGRYYSNSWTDNAGNFWLFGGVGNAISGDASNLNDL